MTWHRGPFCVLDTETTGVDVETDRIVTAAVVDVLPPGSEPTSRTKVWLINPGVDIPEAATAVHGITTEHAREHGQDPAVALGEIAGRVCIALRRGIPLVAMNAPFDLTLLDRELMRHNLGGLAQRLGGYDQVRPVLDPYVIDKQVDKYRKRKRTLTALCEHYQVELTEAHAADGDALGAVRVLWRMAQIHVLTRWQPDELHDYQIEWRAEQSKSFAAYLRKQGKPADDVDGHWPIRPYPNESTGAVA